MTPMRPRSLREAHAHLPWHGLALSMMPLAECKTREECLQRISEESARLDREGISGWILASGARIAAWPDPRWPTREELDRLSPRPCALMSFDHHSLAASSAAIAAAGLRDDSPDPPGGVIVRDPITHRPTGVFLEAAAQLIWSAIPEPPPEIQQARLRAAIADLARHGFTQVHDLLAPDWLGPALAELSDAGQLPLSVALFAPLDRLDHQARAAAGPGGWSRPDVTLAGGKLFADGTLNSRTAAMLHPYRDPLPGLPRGKPLLTREDIAAGLARCADLNLTLAVHAIGDAAVRTTLDAFDLFTSSLRPSVPSCVLRIEHAELIDEADIPRFHRPGLIASLQPCHLLADIEALECSLPHRLDRVLPIRDLINAGLEPGRTLLFGSDVPVVRPDPIDSITAATIRRRPDIPLSRAIAPDQAIDEATAWQCFRPG
ncbi:MAG: amidohydrolase family protein [Phycisphaerales bacterium]|nr:amidohydrolase family protein [Phycisphaerales bacterium]